MNNTAQNPKEYLATLPPSSVNNSRKILKEWIDKAEKAHGDEGSYYVRKLEDMGFTADTRSGADWGNLMEEINEE